jgi:hypothetical protein
MSQYSVFEGISSMASGDKAGMNMPDMKLELVPMPVSDIERAKAFY